jgi:hypothetical protein
MLDDSESAQARLASNGTLDRLIADWTMVGAA